MLKIQSFAKVFISSNLVLFNKAMAISLARTIVIFSTSFLYFFYNQSFVHMRD